MSLKAASRRTLKWILIALVLGFSGAAALAASPAPAAKGDSLPGLTAPALSARAQEILNESLSSPPAARPLPIAGLDGPGWRPPGFHGNRPSREPVGSFWHAPDGP